MVDPVTSECIPEREIAGDKTGAQFSDRHCYCNTAWSTPHAAGKEKLTLPSGKAYSREDLEKLAKTRLATYCHQTLLHSITGAVQSRINTVDRQQNETFEAFLEKLRTDKVETAQPSRLWGIFMTGLSYLPAVCSCNWQVARRQHVAGEQCQVSGRFH